METKQTLAETLEQYDSKNFKIGKTIKPGDKIDAKVVLVRIDELQKLIKPESLPKWKTTQPTDKMIKVVAQATMKNGKVIDRETIFNHPKDKDVDGKWIVNPKSPLNKWAEVYGSLPFEGQDIYLLADGLGFYQFQL